MSQSNKLNGQFDNRSQEVKKKDIISSSFVNIYAHFWATEL